MVRVGDLEIDQDVRFSELEWRLQRAGWFGLVALMFVAFSGLFGHGPVSWSGATTPDGSLDVSYERFGRRGGSQEIVIRAPASAAEGGEWSIDITAAYIADLTIDAVTPAPDSVGASRGSVRYTFRQATPDASLEARFSVTPSTVWGHAGEVRLAEPGSQSLRVQHSYFP